MHSSCSSALTGSEQHIHLPPHRDALLLVCTAGSDLARPAIQLEANMLSPEEFFWDITPFSRACYLLHAGSLLGSFFDQEDGGDIFLRNIGCL
jgi:hypothetical protein